MTDTPTTYRHTQRAPLCLLIYALAIAFLVLAWTLRGEPVVGVALPPVGLLMLGLAASFHHLTVADEGDRLAIRFGPLPLFKRSIRYEEINSAEAGRTAWYEGWGIHISLRGGWVWNLSGWDCVVLRHRRGTLRIGTDDAENLARFVAGRIGQT